MTTLIESFSLLSVIWLATEFIRFCSQHRPSPAQPDLAAVEPDDQPLPPAGDEPEQPQFQHRVVPFQRRPATMPEPNDSELISFAKSIGFPGSKKWSFKRKLTRPVRAALLQQWSQEQAS